MYLKWAVQAIASFVISLFCYVTNWAVVLFCDNNGEIKQKFLKLWQTYDDSVYSSDVVLKKELPRFLLYDYKKHYAERHDFSDPELAAVNNARYWSDCINNDFTFVERIQRYICGVYWLTRNCAYGFAFWWFGANVVPADIVYTKRTADLIICHYGNYWKYADSREIITLFGRRLEWNTYLGWKLRDSAETKLTRCMIATRIAFKIVKLDKDGEDKVD